MSEGRETSPWDRIPLSLEVRGEINVEDEEEKEAISFVRRSHIVAEEEKGRKKKRRLSRFMACDERTKKPEDEEGKKENLQLRSWLEYTIDSSSLRINK